MNSTTGAEPTASVMAVLVSAERKRRVMEAEGRGKRVKAVEGEGRAAWRRAWGVGVSLGFFKFGRGEECGERYTDWKRGRAKDVMVVMFEG